jgi:hypothetical protein
MTNEFIIGLDRQQWVSVAPSPNAHSAGVSLTSDLRNSRVRNPFISQLVSATALNRYNVITKSWNYVQSPALAGTFGAGSGCIFAPSRGLNGTIGTGSSTTSIVTSTTITAVGANMLANRGGSGDYGFKIRIISPSSGKIEERWIAGNSAGTTPTILLTEALSFTPASGDTYEILAGRLFMLNAGVLASGSWKSLEVALNTLTTCGYTNLPATVSTDFSAIALDEQYVPYDMNPGEGFIAGSGTYNGGALKCLVATATASSTITGQATGGDATVLANEYRNFQIRIVEDTTAPTAVGQRRIISSHTVGASPVYTLGSAWTVTPSANAKFVIEYPNQIILRSTATTTVYTYNYSGLSQTNGTTTIASDAWSTTYYGVAPAVMALGCQWFPSFGIRPDAGKYSRHSYCYFFRGGGTSTCDLFDIAGGTTGAWTSTIVYDGAVKMTTGTCSEYAPCDNEGRFGYLNIYTASAINQIFRFDVKNGVLSPYTPTDWVQSGTAAVGNRLATYCIFLSDTEKYTTNFLLTHTATNAFELVTQV